MRKYTAEKRKSGRSTQQCKLSNTTSIGNRKIKQCIQHNIQKFNIISEMNNKKQKDI